MSKTSRQLDRMLAKIDTMPYGQEERKLLDEIIALADEVGDNDRGFAARAKLVGSANHLGDTESMLTAFAWCLSMHDRSPKRYSLSSGPGGVNLLWAYKWMVPALAASPIFPRKQVEQALTDLSSKFAAEGEGESGVLSTAYTANLYLGDVKKSEKIFERLTNTPRDRYSDCEACTVSENIGRLARLGKNAEAVAEMERMIDAELSCSEEPARAIAKAFVPLLATDKGDRALGLHFPAYRSMRENPRNLSQLADHVMFCAVSGNLDRGVELVERHISWLVWDSLDARSLMFVLLAFAVLLENAAKDENVVSGLRIAESKELEVLLGLDPAKATVSELAQSCWGAATKIASDFDKRNGNDTYSADVARHRRLVGVRYEALISADSFAMPVAAEVPEPTTALEWTSNARELWINGNLQEAITAAEAGLAVAAGFDRARLLLAAARIYDELKNSEQAASALDERWRELTDLGLGEIAAAERALGALWLTVAQTEDVDELLAAIDATAPHTPMVEAHFAAFRAHKARLGADFETTVSFGRQAYEGDLAIGDAYGAARSCLVIAEALVMSSELDEADLWLDRLEELQEDRVLRSQAKYIRARTALIRGDAASALGLVNDALAVTIAVNTTDGLIQAAMLSADVLDALGRHNEAIARTSMAVRAAERSESSDLHGVRLALAQRLTHTGRANEALDILMPLYENRESLGLDTEMVAGILYHSASALSTLGQEDAAVGAWVDAAPLFDSAANPESAADCKLQAAQGLMSLEKPVEAVALLDEAAASLHAAARADSAVAIEIALARGVALARLGRRDGIDELVRVLELARAANNSWQVGRALRARAFAALALGERVDSVSFAIQSAEAFLTSGDTSSASATEGLAASILAEDEQREEAVVIYQAALARLDRGDNLFIGLSFDLAVVLDQLGRTAEAEQVRAEADTLT
jgi:cellulose synthase operon protein C